MEEHILLEWNPWWTSPYRVDHIHRDVMVEFENWMPRKEIIAITGTRRSGKTTLMYIMIESLLKTIPKENILFIKCDDERVMEQNVIEKARELHAELFNPKGRVFIFLDEVQELNGWSQTVKRIYDLADNVRFGYSDQELDDNRMYEVGGVGGGDDLLTDLNGYGIKIILTGSRIMKEELGMNLAGRFVKIEVYPFSFREFLGSRGIMTDNRLEMITHKDAILNQLREFIEWGGFPEIVLERDPGRKRELLHFYSDSILYRDVVRRSGLTKIDKLEILKNLLLTNVSNLMSFNKLSKQLRISQDTVTGYVHAMENASFIFPVSTFAFSLKKQLVNPKKIYCIDSGLRNVVGFRFSSDVGRLYENIVYLQLRRRFRDIYYWKANGNGGIIKNGEVDFVIMEGNKVIQAIQVCYDIESAEVREIKALLKCLDEFDLKEGVIVTGRVKKTEVHDKKLIHYIPLWEWLLENA